MKSLRLGPELEHRLERAAVIKGESLSEFIRRAAAERADETLAASDSGDFDDILGVVDSRGGRARRTGEAFREAIPRSSDEPGAD